MDKSDQRSQLIASAKLTEEDIIEVLKSRRSYNRFGFAYQIGFVRLMNRFPAQTPLEIIEDLLTFTKVQLGIDSSEIDLYQKRQQTISQHQIRILQYLNKSKFGSHQRQLLENFLLEQSTRLEQTSVLEKSAEQFLREKGIHQPAT